MIHITYCKQKKRDRLQIQPVTFYILYIKFPRNYIQE